MLKSKIQKHIIKFTLINCVLYLLVCFVLIYWPTPSKKEIENYDFSSINKNSVNGLTEVKKWITVRDGHKLFSRLYPSKSKVVMILIHGSGSESRYLKSLADSIAHTNIATVLTPDLRGHGESDGQKGDIDFIGQLENGIEDLIYFSKNQLGAHSIILAGHSSGGGLVLRYIGNSQFTKVDKAILISPYLGHEAPTVKPNSGNWVTVAVKRWVGLSMLNLIGITKFNAMPVLFFNRPAEYNDKLQAPSYSYRMAVNFAPKDYLEDIEMISIPTLVLVGGQDESFYPEQFGPVFMPAQKFARVEIFDDANHLNIVSHRETLHHIEEWMKE